MERKDKVHSYGWTDKLYYVTRISTMFAFLIMFFSEFNPARVYTQMNKNVSLFTTAVSYDKLIVNVPYEMRMGLITEGHFNLLMGAAGLVCIGVIALCVSACVSLGNIKFKRLSNISNLVGGVVMIMGLYSVYTTHGGYKTLDGRLGYELATEVMNVVFYIRGVIASVNIVSAVVLTLFQAGPAKR